MMLSLLDNAVAFKEKIMTTTIVDPDEDRVVYFTMLLPPGLYQVSWSLYSSMDGGEQNWIFLYKQVCWGEMVLCTINAMVRSHSNKDYTGIKTIFIFSIVSFR